MSNINLEEMEKEVMDGLKDFQRETVNHIHSLFKKGQNRVLVADEVGLGKTWVAKGVIAKFAKYRNQYEGDKLIKVVYVCSNSSIVDQNLEDLNIGGNFEVENSFTSRLSMQHLTIFKQEAALKGDDIKIQLIPLTPKTSLDFKKSQGIIHERALMFEILRRIDELSEYESILSRIFQYNLSSPTSWKKAINDCILQIDECDEEYLKYMKCMLWRGVDENNKDCPEKNDESENYSIYINDLIKFCKDIKEKGWNLKNKRKCKEHIVNFRKVFASISLEKLDADLIIMDEFQRFKDLLNPDDGSDLARLTKKFFNEDARILLLSATPYKLYSTLEEISNENVDAHYSEFFELINFLKKSQKEQEKFKEVWSNYSICLREFEIGNNALISAKNKAEKELFKNVCRTERFSETCINDIINDSEVNPITVINKDIESYIKFQKLLDETAKINVPIDYIKSTPYIMAFMENYQLKTNIEDYYKKNNDDMGMFENDLFWLNKTKINNYQRISPNNSRLNYLIDNILKNNESHLLWVPPSMPYYELGGAFKNHEGFSKTLIFSSWEMVPRMISSLVSYEAERQTFGRLRSNVKYFTPDDINSSKRRSYSRLQFLKNYDFYNTPRVDVKLPVFMLLYPSSILSEVYDPVDCLNRKLSINQIEKEIKIKIKQKLDMIQSDEGGKIDPNWYVLAPLLLDKKEHVGSWFNKFKELCTSDKTFGQHYCDELGKLKDIYDSDIKWGRKPDDLVDVLCDIAIASPAVCAYRAYEREISEEDSMMSYLEAPTQIARRFVRYMNLPESISVIDLHFNVDSEASYWKSVLKYSKDGNLQAVFDEYVHLLSKPGKNNNETFNKLNYKFLASFEYITTRLSFDTFEKFKSRVENDGSSDESDQNEKNSHDKFRIHYAASFAKERSDGGNSNRRKTIIDAFNSPFRPFVLASTSIGQEGLDFHKYCRKIVHWNLPSNPIDLEQREGRINRFKSLSIRQNIAKRYGWNHDKFNADIWEDLFKMAGDAESKNSSELIPFWGLNKYDENLKIERIFPMYPYSIDKDRYDRLINILSLYRLTLGQSRQEKLIDSILEYKQENDNLNNLFINLSPYYKNRKANR